MEKKSDSSDLVTNIAILVIAVIIGIYLYQLKQHLSEYREKCEKSGGEVLWKKKYNPVCAINGEIKEEI